MDRVLRHAMAEGLPSMTAIQMATIKHCRAFWPARELGMIAPGRWADILVVEDLKEFRQDSLIARGRVVAKDGTLTWMRLSSNIPPGPELVHLKRPVHHERLCLRAAGRGARRRANVIEVVENQIPRDTCAGGSPRRGVREGRIQIAISPKWP